MARNKPQEHQPEDVSELQARQELTDASELPIQQPAGSGASEGTAEHVTEEEPMVVYIGEFPRREISVADWEKAGIRDMPAVVWDHSRNMRVPASVFSDQALQVLRQEGHFEVP